MRPTVTASLIVRNEAGFLPGCLASLRGRVDEIVIVDTGSTDATVALAKDAGARVLHDKWADDFATPRNLGLDAATSDWILYIDADERLGLPRPGHLGDWIDPDAEACFVRFCPRQGYTRYREWRLFRRDDRIRFVGRFHETVIPSIRRVSAETGRSVANSAVEIDHLGYDQPNPSKLSRNLAMLTNLLEHDPQRVFCWHHLAETLMALGQPDKAIEAAQRGLQIAATAVEEDQRAAGSLIRQLIARDMIARNEPVLEYAASALGLYPADHSLRLTLAVAAIEEKLPQRAIEALIGLMSVDLEQLHTGLLAFDRRIFGEAAFITASRTCMALGDREGAARCIALFAKAGGTAAKAWVVDRLRALRDAASAVQTT